MIALLAAAGLSLAAGHSTTTDQANIAKAEAKVEDLLKDPDSAKFTRVKVKGVVVCGYVNAKNSFGGYTGAKAFMTNADPNDNDPPLLAGNGPSLGDPESDARLEASTQSMIEAGCITQP